MTNPVSMPSIGFCRMTSESRLKGVVLTANLDAKPTCGLRCVASANKHLTAQELSRGFPIDQIVRPLPH